MMNVQQTRAAVQRKTWSGMTAFTRALEACIGPIRRLLDHWHPAAPAAAFAMLTAAAFFAFLPSEWWSARFGVVEGPRPPFRLALGLWAAVAGILCALPIRMRDRKIATADDLMRLALFYLGLLMTGTFLTVYCFLVGLGSIGQRDVPITWLTVWWGLRILATVFADIYDRQRDDLYGRRKDDRPLPSAAADHHSRPADGDSDDNTR